MYPHVFRSVLGPRYKSWLTLIFLLPMVLAACRQAESGGRRRTANEAREQADSLSKYVKPTCADITCNDPARCMLKDDVATCVCPRGFEGDGETCTDIDECSKPDLNMCDAHAKCSNRDGDYDCECQPGFTGDGRSCTASESCTADTNNCHPDALCMPGGSDGVSCSCKPGFEGDGKACGDVDECSTGMAMCGEGASCKNRRGSYDCACELPFTGDDAHKGCRDACSAALEDSSKCDSGGHAHCSFTSTGEASCSSCDAGYLGDGKSCKADSECAALGCGSNTVCAGDAGSRRCECAPGFQGDAKSGCEDIDECKDSSKCGGASNRCINVPGGYICGCADGYERVDGECKNIDECARDLDLCDPGADCKDSDGSYECKCKEGYSGDGRSCADIDECAKDDKLCAKQEGTVCRNTPGSYECACPKGTIGNGKDEACACDMTGIWGARIDTAVESKELAAADVVLIQAMKMRTWVWELNRFSWDGKQIKVENLNCGMSDDAELYSPLYDETYSLAIPQKIYDTLKPSPVQSIDLARADALPGKRYVTKPEGVMQGLKLDDPLMSTWFESTKDVPKDAWVDYDNDGHPGVTFWPASTDAKIRGSSSVTYDYLPVELKSGSSLVATRVGCVSVGLRMIRSFDGKFESCNRLRGKVEISRFDARVQGCSVVRMSDWESGEISCDKQGWEDARACNEEQVQFIDDQDLPYETGGDFELVKLGSLDDDIDCAKVRKALPALPR